VTNTTTTPATPAERPLLLDARAAARLCGVSRSHFLAMHSAGKVPLPVRLGRRTLWRGAELAAWIEAGCPARDRWTSMKGGRP
jgi:predicted DNA-binding transcriptional regulator AlpA